MILIMDKTVKYLNSKLTGLAISKTELLRQYTNDKGILGQSPSCVVLIKNSDDIRKITSLCFQLAEKNQRLSLTVRGFGNDTTGASLSSQLVLDTTRYYNQIIDHDPENAVIHAQAGASLRDLNFLARQNDMQLPLVATNNDYTIGEIIANNQIYPLAQRPETIYDLVDKMEVTLANGEAIEIRKLNKKELNQKIGLTSMEGEIYRKIDALIENYQDLIERLPTNLGNYRYAGISQVKTGNSFDLRPLFIGSQGTLGIINEVIVNLTNRPNHTISGLLSFATLVDALDAIDDLLKLKPSRLEIIEHSLFELLAEQGKICDLVFEHHQKIGDGAAYHLLVSFQPRSKITFKKYLKKISHIARQARGIGSELDAPEFYIDLINLLDLTDMQPASYQLLTGARVERIKWQELAKSMNEVAEANKMQLPLYGSVLTEVVNFHSRLDLNSIVGKQTALRLLNQHIKIIHDLDGTYCASGGEGQLKGLFADKYTGPELQSLFQEIKDIFDPYHILSPDSKTATDLKQVANKINQRHA